MYLTTLDPISRDFDRIVRRAFGGSSLSHGALNRGGLSYAPALPMDTVRRDGEVVLRFDVPGVDQDKIDVTVDKGVLTVGPWTGTLQVDVIFEGGATVRPAPARLDKERRPALFELRLCALPSGVAM